jgi:hypothetical protein
MTKNLMENPLVGDEKYAIISHKYTIAHLTATGIDKKKTIGISGYKLLENVEMYPYVPIPLV